MLACVLSHFSHICLFVILWTIACQAPLQGILQVIILEWFAMLSSRGSSQSRGQILVSYI